MRRRYASTCSSLRVAVAGSALLGAVAIGARASAEREVMLAAHAAARVPVAARRWRCVSARRCLQLGAQPGCACHSRHDHDSCSNLSLIISLCQDLHEVVHTAVHSTSRARWSLDIRRRLGLPQSAKQDPWMRALTPMTGEKSWKDDMDITVV
jgi:hypothetical protein